jgi:hypothetical protein
MPDCHKYPFSPACRTISGADTTAPLTTTSTTTTSTSTSTTSTSTATTSLLPTTTTELITSTLTTTLSSILTTLTESPSTGSSTSTSILTTQTAPQTTTQKDDCNKLYLLAGLITGASCMAVICMTGYCLYRKAQRCISNRTGNNEQRVNQTVVLSNNNSILDRRNSDQDLISI